MPPVFGVVSSEPPEPPLPPFTKSETVPADPGDADDPAAAFSTPLPLFDELQPKLRARTELEMTSVDLFIGSPSVGAYGARFGGSGLILPALRIRISPFAMSL